MKYLNLVPFLLCVLINAGCVENSDNFSDSDIDTELTIEGISDTHWTYISLENNRVVGTSPLDDPDGDEEWRKRTDWDIALCGDMIKTNSGDSGIGEGGIIRLDNLSYDQLSSPLDITPDIDRSFN